MAGRTYDESTIRELLARIAHGETLSAICSDASRYPSKSTVTEWALNQSGEHSDFAEQYARARLIQAHGMADEIRDIADNGRNDWMRMHDPDNPGWKYNGEAVQRSKLRVDTLKWLLAKALPKIYGDKIDVTSGGERLNGVAFNIAAIPSENLTQALDLLGLPHDSNSSTDQS